jgi:hypothetical protein
MVPVLVPHINVTRKLVPCLGLEKKYYGSKN